MYTCILTLIIGPVGILSRDMGTGDTTQGVAAELGQTTLHIYLQYIWVQKSKLSAAISIINYLKLLKLLLFFRNDAMLWQHCL